MSLAELQRELNKIRDPVQKNALSSTLTRLVGVHRIKRPKPGQYAALGPDDLNEETATLRRDSIPSFAYTVLREAGKPLTTDEIWASVRARKPNASKHSLVGSLYYYSKIGRIFTLIDAKTFGLREWQNRQTDPPRMSAASATPRPIEGDLIQEVQGKTLEKNHNIPYREGQSFRAHTLQALAITGDGMTLPELTAELRRGGRNTTLKKVSSLVYRLIKEERVQKQESGKFAVRNQQKRITATLNDHGLLEETFTQGGGTTRNNSSPMSWPHEEGNQVEGQDETPQRREESENDSRLFSE